MSASLTQKRGIRSFVLRTGRLTSSQKRGFEQYWSHYGLEVERGMIDAAAIFSRTAPLALEIGFGMGESLLTMAEQQPDWNFIGIEVHPPGVGRLLNQLADKQLDNVRVYREDALAVLNHCIADTSLSRLQLYFPDPWPKKKHHKRRIVQSDFVALISKKLATGGVLHMATDWQAYAEHMIEVLSAPDLPFSNCAGESLYSERPDFRPVTKFEQRGRRLGHGVWDLLFEKNEQR